METSQLENYPFVNEFLTDSSGQVQKVILRVEDYQRLIEALEDEGLYRAMQETRREKPLSREAALQYLAANES